MNHYVISPDVVKISLHPELTNQYMRLGSRLNWRPLTTNLESCEEAPYLYFKIHLKLRPDTLTYAGFTTGAPFMLTRVRDAKKRAFFLRHCVRKISSPEPSSVPLVPLPNMSVACTGEYLIVRVNIDRPLVVNDCFNSVPFATWMFQIIQVDAYIAELPGIRFAFSIERTVTSEERELIISSGMDIPSRGQKAKQIQAHPLSGTQNVAPVQMHQPPPTARPARPLLAHPVAPHPVMAQNVAPRPGMPYPQMNQRPTATPLQPKPYAYQSNRPAPHLQMRPNVAPRPLYMGQPIAKAPPQRYNRAMGPTPSSAPQPPDNLRPVTHPILRLWEDRDLDNPYEPMFVTEDMEFDAKANTKWVVEQDSDHAKRFKYDNLVGIPSSDYPSYYCDGADTSLPDGEPDIEIVVQRKQRHKPDMSEVTSDSGDEGPETKLDAEGKYSAAVISASEYNSSLQNERAGLRRWLEEDDGQEDEDSDEEEEEEEPDSDSSD